jgi:soluble P-type ATPase
VSRRYEIPGAAALEIEHLLLDINGTLTDRGDLIDGVSERLQRIRGDLEIHFLSADTLGTLGELARKLRVSGKRISRGPEKAHFIDRLGPDSCAAIGNGRNDAEMLGLARLGIAVIGPEGASSGAMLNADIVCRSIVDALDLLLDEKAMASTLRP